MSGSVQAQGTAAARRTGRQMYRLPDFRHRDLKLPRVSLAGPRGRGPRLSRARLRSVRLPSLRLDGLGRAALDLDRAGRLGAHLQFFFYLLMFVALLAILTGAGGTGVAMLLAGAALHVLRSSLAEAAAQRQARRERAERRKQVRLRPHRTARKGTAGRGLARKGTAGEATAREGAARDGAARDGAARNGTAREATPREARPADEEVRVTAAPRRGRDRAPRRQAAATGSRPTR